MTSEDIEKSINEIWAMFRETDRRSKETDRQLQTSTALKLIRN